MRIYISFILFGASLLSAGCQPIATSPMDARQPLPTQTSVPASPAKGEMQMTPTQGTHLAPGLQSLIERASEDLANRLAISREQISLLEITEVEWSDSSLDCPQPGMEYLQVITPGYKIVLRANEQSYEYHTNKDAYFVYCEKPIPLTIPKP